jgi:hypothetical protein
MRLIRFILVLLGVAAFLIAAVAVAAEVWSFAAGGKLFAKPLGQIWREQHLLSLQLFQVGVERKLGLDWLWQHVFQVMLAWPPLAVAGAFGALGVVLVLFARLIRGRRRPAPRRFTSA